LFFNHIIHLLVVTKSPEEIVPTVLGVVIGAVAGTLLLILIFMALSRFRQYVRLKEDQLMKMEADRRRIAYELELTKLHISKDNRNLYVPLDVLLNQSDNTYDSEPIYSEIPTGDCFLL